MDEGADKDDEESPSWRKWALEQLKDIHIMNALRKATKILKEGDEAERALIQGVKTPSEIANIELKLKHGLEEMRPRLDAKTYEQVEMQALFWIEVMKNGISNDNIPQGALESARKRPLKAKHTDDDLKQATDDARKDSAKKQKEIDDKTSQEELAKATTPEAAVKILSEFLGPWREAGVIYTLKDLLDKGYLDPLIRQSIPPGLQPITSQDGNTQDTNMVITMPEGAAIVSPGGSAKAFVKMKRCSEKAQITLTGPKGFGVNWKLETYRDLSGPIPTTLGTLTFTVPTFAIPNDYRLMLRVKDSDGRIGGGVFYLRVKGDYPGTRLVEGM